MLSKNSYFHSHNIEKKIQCISSVRVSVRCCTDRNKSTVDTEKKK